MQLLLGSKGIKKKYYVKRNMKVYMSWLINDLLNCVFNVASRLGYEIWLWAAPLLTANI